MGYGARALQALESFYRGENFDLDETERTIDETNLQERPMVGRIS